MAERREIILANHDVIAAAQILAWLAFPHRPEYGVRLIEQWFWARRRFRGEPSPPLPYRLEKKGRITAQLFGKPAKPSPLLRGLERAMDAGRWFDMKVLSGPASPPMFAKFNVSTRSLARGRASRRDDGGQDNNETRDVYSSRRPVLHLASAAEKAFAQLHLERGIEHFDLEMVAFDPVWIDLVLSAAEAKVRTASLCGAFQEAQFYQFRRDTF